MTPHAPVLIENWLPIEAIGAESQRERALMSALPPTYYLHVWWARRPLVASRAAILASVLPDWDLEWSDRLHNRFSSKQSYHAWYTKLIGILGDPVGARRRINFEKATGQNTSGNKYGYPRAFGFTPSVEDLQLLRELLQLRWGDTNIEVLDPMAGGGSIPFEALRFGFSAIANDLNPVAAVVLKSTLEFPARYGGTLSEEILRWGARWGELVEQRLAPFYRSAKDRSQRNIYLWARTILCPSSGKPVPLLSSLWIRKSDDPVAIRILTDASWSEPRFEVVSGSAIDFNADVGTIIQGVARSPWTGETISGDYIKAEAQQNRMGQILYCVEVDGPSGKDYITPGPEDIQMAKDAERELAVRRNSWVTNNIIPWEVIPEASNYDRGHRLYGITRWSDFFSPRQLLAAGTYLEQLLVLEKEIRASMGDERATAIVTYLGLALDKVVDYNCLQAAWHPSRLVVAHLFTKHNFAMTWSFAEFNAVGSLMPWAVRQVSKAYRELAALVAPSQQSLVSANFANPVDRLLITQGSASNLEQQADSSVAAIVVDPPYYDNVQYAELSDYFYVWLKRSVGHLFPRFFHDELTNKDDEAVANPARFKSFGRKKAELAEKDYELKMAGAFREMYRVLKPEGALTVMFTHKRVEAWDTLASALIGAGFLIKASWPLHTESEHSLHIARKNAASSTILLVCRKREANTGGGIWWDDLQGRVRDTARQKAAEFAAQGISGVDLYISTFGPTLSIISEHWPVLTSEVDPKTGQPRPLRPETALDLAREEVVRLRKEGLLLGRDVQFDPVTDWYLMAWDAFKAKEFPYDEARKLAIALGLELDANLMRTKRLVAKKGQFVVMQEPVERRRKGMVDEDAPSFEHLIDAVHTAMMIYDEDGGPACDVFLRKSGLKNDGTFKACLQALLNAIPRTRIKGKWVRPEAETLEKLRLAFFDDLVAPVEEEPELPQATQMALEGIEAEDEDDEDGEGDE